MRLSLPLALLAIGLLATTPARTNPAPPSCQSHAPRHDRLEVRCTWPQAPVAQQLRFEAHFAGSHDDTTASLVASLDGKPLACTAGSKTVIDGQDEGDVTLHCGLTIEKVDSAQPVLLFQLAWHHARHSGFELRSP